MNLAWVIVGALVVVAAGAVHRFGLDGLAIFAAIYVLMPYRPGFMAK